MTLKPEMWSQRLWQADKAFNVEAECAAKHDDPRWSHSVAMRRRQFMLGGAIAAAIQETLGAKIRE